MAVNGTTKADKIAFVGNDTYNGLAGVDTLIFNQTDADLTTSVMNSIEIFQAAVTTGGTTFTLDTNDIGAWTKVVGNKLTDTLSLTTTAFDLHSVTLTSVEILEAGSANATTFTVDQTDLAKNGSVIGVSGKNDTLITSTTGVKLDLSSTTLTDIEILKAGSAKATTFTVDTGDLASLQSIVGGAGVDTLINKDATFDLTDTALTSIEVIKSTSKVAVQITVDSADLANNGSVIGGAAKTDMLIGASGTLDLTHTKLTGIEIIKADSGGTDIIVDQVDLFAKGSVLGDVGSDSLGGSGSTLNLTSTTLSGIETLQATATTAFTFTVDALDLASLAATGNGSIEGAGVNDHLIVKGASTIDLSSIAVDHFEIHSSITSVATTFTVDSNSLGTVGAGVVLTGTAKTTDTVQTSDTGLDLSGTTLVGIEILKALATDPTTFTVDQLDLTALGASGQIQGNLGDDTLVSTGTALDLRSTTLSSVEILQTTEDDSTITVNQADLASGGSVSMSTSAADTLDKLVSADASLDLTSTTLTGVDILQAGLTANTSFTVNQGNLNGLSDDSGEGTIKGTVGTGDTVIASGSALDLSSTTLSSVEKIQTTATNGTVLTVDLDDLAANGSVVGVAGTDSLDTLTINGTDFDLSGTTLSSIDILLAEANGTTFTVDQADLASGGSVQGVGGTNILQSTGASLNLTSTTLDDVDILRSNATETGPSTLTVDTDDLAVLTSITGNAGQDDVLVVVGSSTTVLDLSGKTLTDIAELKTTQSGGVQFIVDDAQLADLQSVTGVAGTGSIDTLTTSGTDFDLSSTALTSIEKLVSDLASTTFTVDNNDLASGGSIIGLVGGTDIVQAAGATLDLSSTTLTDIEQVKADAGGTAITVTQTELNSAISITGGASADSLTVKGATFDTTSATLTDIETLIGGGGTASTTFTVDKNDLKSGGGDVTEIDGTGAASSLTIKGTDFDLTSVTLSDIEILKADATAGDTTFTLSNADLASGGSVIGTTGAADTILAAGTELDLSSTTLSGIEVVQAGSDGTKFTFTQAQFTSGIDIEGTVGKNDTLVIKGTSFDVSGATLNSIETLVASSSLDTTFTVKDVQLGTGQITAIDGGAGNDTVIATGGTGADFTSTALTSVENIQTNDTGGYTFTVDFDLVLGGSVVGVAGSGNLDTLVIKGTGFDLTATTLSSIDILKAGTNGTTFTVNQNDLASGGSVQGIGGTNTIGVGGVGGSALTLDLTSTTLSNVQVIETNAAAAGDSTLTVDQADLASGGTVQGNAAHDDTLVVINTGNSTVDLSSTTLTDIHILKTTQTGGVEFIVDHSDLQNLGASGSIVGVTGVSNVDVLAVNGTDFDLSSTSLTSIEVLQAVASGTTFKVDQDDLASGGSIIGNGGTVTVLAAGGTLDLSSTTLSGVTNVKADANGTEIIVTKTQFDSLVIAGDVAGNDALLVQGSVFDTTSKTLTGIEILEGGGSTNTVFTFDKADLVSGAGSVDEIDGTGTASTLTVKGSDFDLTGVTLFDVQVLKADATAGNTTFTLSNDDLAGGGSIIGTTGGSDTIQAVGTSLDLSNTTLSDIEIVKANAAGTTLTFSKAGFVGINAQGGIGTDTLVITGTGFDVTSNTLSSIETLEAGSNAGVTFTVKSTQLGTNKITEIDGGGGTDKVIVTTVSSTVDLSSTTLSSIENLTSNITTSTLFVVKTGSIAGVEIDGHTGVSSSKDTVQASGAVLDITSTTFSSIEILKASTATGTEFIMTQDQVYTDLQIQGIAGKNDTLTIDGAVYDLTLKTLTSIDILKSRNTGTDGTVFTVDQADLAANGSVIGSTNANDVLIVTETSVDLTSTTLTDVENLQVSSDDATTFKVDQTDLASLASISGGAGADTLIVKGNSADLSNTTLSSIDILKADASGGYTFTVNQGDLASGGSVVGIAGTGSLDTLTTNDASLDLTSTTLSSIETLLGSGTQATQFELNQANVSGLQSIDGNGQAAVISAIGSLDLSSLALTSINTIQAGSTANTTLTITDTELASLVAITGSAGADTLVVVGTDINLTTVSLTGVETLKAGTDSDTTFTLTSGTLDDVKAIVGGAGFDTLVTDGSLSALDLSGTTLNNVEILKSAATGNFNFIVDANDLASGGSVVGDAGETDTITAAGATLDLRARFLTSIEVLATQYQSGTAGTTFTIDQANLATITDVNGSGGKDTLSVNGVSMDLTSTDLSSIEVLTTTSTNSTTFTVDQSDLNSAALTIKGSTSAADTLIVFSTTGGDLSNTTLSGVELIHSTNNTTGNPNSWTVGNGLGSATIQLGLTNTEIDTVAFNSAYKADVTSNTALQAHMVSIDNFEAGVGGDVINISAVTNGAPGAVTDITGAITSLNPSTLLGAANLAASGDGSTTAVVHTFQFGGNTYAVIDNSLSDHLTTSDAIIKIVGTPAVDANNFVL